MSGGVKCGGGCFIIINNKKKEEYRALETMLN